MDKFDILSLEVVKKIKNPKPHQQFMMPVYAANIIVTALRAAYNVGKKEGKAEDEVRV